MSFTDDWKAGNLNDIWYYVKDNHNNIYPARYVTMQSKFAQFLPREIVEVVSSVPSYEDFKLLKSLAENGQSAIDTNQRLAKVAEQLKTENAELLETNYSLSTQVKYLLALQKKENKKVEKLIGLLKECRECMMRAEINYGYDYPIADIFSDIYKCINTAIIESEEQNG